MFAMETSLNYRLIVKALLGFLVLIALSGTSSAQGRAFGFSLGTSHYIGDLGGSKALAPWKATDFESTRIAISSFVEWPLEGKFQLHAKASFLQLAGDDQYGDVPSNISRNLHFRSSVWEAQLRGQFNLWDQPRHWNRTAGSRGYLFLGVGAFTYNPKARLRNDANDVVNPKWYALRELNTEGQESPYGFVALSLPMGFGFDWNISGGWQIGMEVNWRYTSTDYLDDVSSTYGNPDDLSEIAMLLSSQANLYSITITGDEGGSLQDHAFSETGLTPRGNPLSRDGFGTVQINVSRPDASLRSRPGSWVGRFRRMGWLR